MSREVYAMGSVASGDQHKDSDERGPNNAKQRASRATN